MVIWPRSALDQPALAAKIFPHPRRRGGGYVIPYRSRSETDGLPLPPVELREGYGVGPKRRPDDKAYLDGGRSNVVRVRSAMDATGFALTPSSSLLEFGCATGRMLRWFEVEARAGCECWGVDLTAASIAWCQQNLSPPFHFATTTSAPHLPFEDNYFDLVFAGSVFTHIAELADAWLLELRRVTRPNGRLYITVFDDVSVSILRERWPGHAANRFLKRFDAATKVLSSDYSMYSFKSGPKRTRVGYRRAPLLEKLGRWFEVRKVIDEAYGWQSGYMLEKRPRPSAGAS